MKINKRNKMTRQTETRGGGGAKMRSRSATCSSNRHGYFDVKKLFGLFLISIVIARAVAGNWSANFEFGLSAR